MSHMAVLVISKDINEVDEILAPYQECDGDNVAREFTEFINTTEEYLEEYETEGREMIRLQNGSVLSLYDSQFKFCQETNKWNYKYIYPEDSTKIEVPYKECFKTFKEFMEEYHGCTFHEEFQAYGYFHNPNAKWDWWSIGGRYSDRIITKGGRKVNQASARDIDFQAMQEERFNNTMQSLAEDIFSEHGGHPIIWGIDAGTQIEVYLEEVKNMNPISCFAIVSKDKGWQEQGSMGWWGVVSDAKDTEVWQSYLQSVLSNLEDDDILTFVDCHI